MNQVALYPLADGQIAVIRPSANCGLTIEQIAGKDTPEGVPYLIIPADQIPSDRTYREAWEADFSEPHGYGLSDEDWQRLWDSLQPPPPPPEPEPEPIPEDEGGA